MKVAILDSEHVILRLEEIVDPDYQPSEPWIEAEDGWGPGDTVIDGQHTPAPVVEAIPESVSSRQFKLQLLSSGLLDSVEAWVSSQDRAVQIAYVNSGTFVRNEPMMQQGFAALGFTPEQGDAFFLAASKL